MLTCEEKENKSSALKVYALPQKQETRLCIEIKVSRFMHTDISITVAKPDNPNVSSFIPFIRFLKTTHPNITFNTFLFHAQD